MDPLLVSENPSSFLLVMSHVILGFGQFSPWDMRFLECGMLCLVMYVRGCRFVHDRRYFKTHNRSIIVKACLGASLNGESIIQWVVKLHFLYLYEIYHTSI